MPTGVDAQSVGTVSFCGPGSSRMATGMDNALIRNAEFGFAERLGKIKNFGLQLLPCTARTDIGWGVRVRLSPYRTSRRSLETGQRYRSAQDSSFCSAANSALHRCSASPRFKNGVRSSRAFSVGSFFMRSKTASGVASQTKYPLDVLTT